MFRGISAVNIDSKGRIAIPKRYRGLVADAKPPREVNTDQNVHISGLEKSAPADQDASQSVQQSPLVLTIDTEAPCLLLYRLEDWEVIEAKIQALPSFNAQARRIQRLLIGHAQEIDIDANGRILLPPLLRDYGKLDKRLMMVGQGKKIELWDELSWHSHREVWLANSDSAQADFPEELQTISL